MTKETEELRNLNLEREELLAKKEELRKKLHEHRDSVTDQDCEELRSIKEKLQSVEERIADAQKRADKDHEEEFNKENFTKMNEKMDRSELLASKEYRDAFFKKLQGKALSEEEARSITSASSSGGAAIPTMTMDKIIGQMKESAPMLSLVTVMNIPELISLPKENVVNDASWVAEDTDSTVGDDSLSSITLNAYKLIRTVKITAKIEVMSIDAFEKWIVDTMVKKMKAAIDKAVFSGSGSTGNQPTGLDGETWNETNSITVGATASLTYDNLVDLEALVGEDYINNAVFVMNRKTLASIKKLKDDNKRPLFERMIEDGFRGNILGIPVKLDKNVKDNELYLGDFASGYIINFAKAIEFATSKEAGFMSGATVYRGLALLDGKPTGVPGAIVKVVKTVTPGP